MRIEKYVCEHCEAETNINDIIIGWLQVKALPSGMNGNINAVSNYKKPLDQQFCSEACLRAFYHLKVEK